MSKALSEANRKAFDAFAETYNIHPWQQRLAQQILTALQNRRDWLGVDWSTTDDRKVRLLDYACGTGAATIALWPLVTDAVGMDLSEGMVKKYNEAMAQLEVPFERAHAVVQDLADGSSTSQQQEELFDVAIVSLALHHVTDPELLLRRLAEHIKPRTGVLIILDFLPFEHSHSKHKGKLASMAHTITKHGFSEEQMGELYDQAGLKDFGIQVEEQITVMGDEHGQTERRIFVARGTRAA